MVKGDDIKRRKLNKANRKKLQKDPSAVSTRVASIIAAKKRRQSGKRRRCQGMCFSLPTLEDPFNDRRGKDIDLIQSKKPVPSRAHDKKLKREPDVQRKRTSVSDKLTGDHEELKRPKGRNQGNKKTSCTDRVEQDDQNRWLSDKNGAPSKFLILCLKSIHDSLLGDGQLNGDQDKPLFVDTWGVEFWKSYSAGKDIFETSATSPTFQQIAWVASTAADTFASKEEQGVSFTSPFLIYLVPSQKDAAKVRSVLKSLKALGIHTVSLHPGASLEHQIHGLKSCEPEFLVATPERLWELVSLKALDISGASFMVIDGLGTLSESGCLDLVQSIKQSISGNPRTVIFQGCSSCSEADAVKTILKGPVHKLSLDSIQNQKAGILR